VKRSPLRRKKPLRAKGRSRFPKKRDPDYLEYIRRMPCLLRHKVNRMTGRQAMCWGRTEAAHVTTCGAGGEDRGNTVPMCSAHHARQGRVGIKTFQEEFGIDLVAEAKRLEAEYQPDFAA
jgi:hypothetical protein